MPGEFEAPEFENVMDGIAAPDPAKSGDPESGETKVPLVQIFEERSGFLVIADLAEYREEDLVVTFKHQTLTVAGTRGLAIGEDRLHSFYLLPPDRCFVNNVHFSAALRPEAMRVCFRNGFLVAWLPKEDEDARRR